MNAPNKTIVVIGAAGGVGRHTVRALLDANYHVRAVDRKDPASMPELHDLVSHPLVSWHKLRVDRDDLAPVLQNAWGVINTAADVGLSESYPEVVASNVVAVDRLFSAATEAQCHHLVHLSAGSLYIPGPGLRVETDPLLPTSDYARSKLDAEGIFLRSSRNLTHWTILRPSYVYGPGCTSMAAGLVTLPPILGDFLRYQPGFRGGARTTWCHVEDLARAILTVLGNPDAFEQIFNVSDNTPQAAGECITSITEAYGLEIGLVIPLATSLIFSGVRNLLQNHRFEQGLRTSLRQLWRRLLRKHQLTSPLRPRIDRHAALHLVQDLVLDNRKLVALGWKPKWVSFSAGISSTIDWYKKEGWVPTYDPAHLERLRLDAKPLYYSFDQTLSGSLEVAPHATSILPSLALTDLHEELVERLDLPLETPRDGSSPNKVVIELEITLRSLIRLNGEIDGRIWIGGISGRAASLQGTYHFQWRLQCLTLDFGFQDELGNSYRSTLVAYSPRWANSLVKPVLPTRYEGPLFDRHGETLGTLQVESVVSETLVSMLLGFR